MDPADPSTLPRVPICEMLNGDIGPVAAMHGSTFPSNVWSRFGGGLLQSYLWLFLASPHAVALVARTSSSDGELAVRHAPTGYILGVLDPPAHRTWVRRHATHRLLRAAPTAAARHPLLTAALIRRRLAALLRRRTPVGAGPASPEPAPPAPVAALSHVAVHRDRRGEGIGDALVDAFVSRAAESGAHRVDLATLDREGAGPWYEARGWWLHTQRKTFDGRWIRLYRRRL